MKCHWRTAASAAAALLWGSALAAQVPADSVLRRQQRTLDSLAAVIRALQTRIDELSRGRAAGDTTGSAELAALRAAAAAAAADSVAAASSQQPRLGQNALNPEITVTGDVRAHLQRQSSTPAFELGEFEVGFQSVLDPFATAKVFASFHDGEAAIEEGYFYFPALPLGLRMDIGRFRQDIGELNRWHAHALPTDDYPLVIRRYGSDEGIAGTGVSLYYALPFSGSVGTWEITAQGTTADNEVLYAGGNRAGVNAKLQAFWQLSRATYLMASASGAYGTNPDTSLKTTLGVLAARFTWRPPAEGTSREFTVRGELWQLNREFSGTGPARRGWYADATWKLNRRLVVGTRYDNVQSPDTAATEWAVTPTLTYWQSEFVFIRGGWERSRDVFGATRDRVTIQAVFAMGPHKHELF